MKQNGYLHAFGAFFIWGLLPLFWKLLDHLSPWEILSQRILWAGLAFVLFAIISGNRNAFYRLLTNPRARRPYLLSGTLLSFNWFIFIYLVVNERVLEISLAYFLNPLMNVFLGMVIFKERLNRLQWVAIGFAMAGMILMGVQSIRFPWLSITLAATFAAYGVIRKQGSSSTIVGASIEGVWMAVLSLPILIYYYGNQVTEPVMVHWLRENNLILFMISGLLTIIPVLLFTSSARLLPLSSVGVMQYIAPSMHFALAVLIFKEPFGWLQLQSYLLVWMGLIVYTTDLIKRSRVDYHAKRGEKA